MNDIPNALRSEVAFVGTWMRGERRDVFLRELRKKGVPISIWGARWQSSPLWSELKDVWRGPALSGRDYVAAIQGAKVCLGMLSKGNRDEHTTRSLEIPYANGLLCAERTPEHETLFKNNEQAVFWRDADECAQKCLELLGNDTRRAHIRMAGAHRVRELKVGHEDICRQILDMV